MSTIFDKRPANKVLPIASLYTIIPGVFVCRTGLYYTPLGSLQPIIARKIQPMKQNHSMKTCPFAKSYVLFLTCRYATYIPKAYGPALTYGLT